MARGLLSFIPIPGVPVRPASLVLAALLPGCFYDSGAACDDPAFDPQYTPRDHLTDAATVDAAAGADGELDRDECEALCEQLELEGMWNEVTGCTAVESGDTGDGMQVTCEGEWQRICPGGRAPRAGLVRVRQARGGARGRWLGRMAAMEAASVRAFRELAEDLAQLGAPAALVTEARRGAVDEVRHARMVAGMARAMGGSLPRLVARPRVRVDLDGFAAHNAAAGCVAETWSALIARHRALRAPAALRPAFQRIAGDEARHADLAWEIDRWARAAGAHASRVAAARRDMVVVVRAEALRRAPPGLGLPTPARASKLVDALDRALWTA